MLSIVVIFVRGDNPKLIIEKLLCVAFQFQDQDEKWFDRFHKEGPG